MQRFHLAAELQQRAGKPSSAGEAAMLARLARDSADPVYKTYPQTSALFREVRRLDPFLWSVRGRGETERERGRERGGRARAS